MVDRERKSNRRLDRGILLGYLSVLIVVLLAAGAWATLGLAHSNVAIALIAGFGGLLIGILAGRAHARSRRGLLFALILAGLLVLSSIAEVGNSYQFAWLFSAISGLIIARREWPWWGGSERK